MTYRSSALGEGQSQCCGHSGEAPGGLGEGLEGRGVWRVIAEIAEPMVGGRGRKTEEKEQDNLGRQATQSH